MPWSWWILADAHKHRDADHYHYRQFLPADGYRTQQDLRTARFRCARLPQNWKATADHSRQLPKADRAAAVGWPDNATWDSQRCRTGAAWRRTRGAAERTRPTAQGGRGSAQFRSR